MLLYDPISMLGSLYTPTHELSQYPGAYMHRLTAVIQACAPAPTRFKNWMNRAPGRPRKNGNDIKKDDTQNEKERKRNTLYDIVPHRIRCCSRCVLYLLSFLIHFLTKPVGPHKPVRPDIVERIETVVEEQRTKKTKTQSKQCRACLRPTLDVAQCI